MNELVEKENIIVENLIYEVRGKQVMLDSDLARLYGCVNGTKDINKAVKRNIERFPVDFYFQLTKEEYSRFQNGTLNKKRGNNTKYLPHAFTEQGVAMLASVLKTSVASEMSVKIMRAFVAMKKYISSNLIEQRYINNLVIEHEERLQLMEDTFSNFKENNNHIFFEGQIYDAYSLLIDIFNKSQTELIIIDNYIDKKLLDVLSKINKNVLVITNKYDNQDYNKYKKQYNNIKLLVNNTFHDRFIIIDNKILYHCGASFKDLGNKCFAITKIEDEEILHNILKYINKENVA